MDPRTRARVRHGAGLLLALSLALAGRAHAQVGSIIQVTDGVDRVLDDGLCSLREAIIASNGNANADPSAVGCQGTGIDSIRFSLDSGSNPQIEIGPTALPTITDRVTIAGNTGGQTRAVLNGPAGLTGLHVGPTAADSTLRFLVIQGFATGVHLQGAGSVLISSYIGTDANGVSAIPNETGVLIEADDVRVGGATGTTPGGACTGECNLISGNASAGISLGGRNATIQGNFIGTDVLGEAGDLGSMGNGTGISGGTFGSIIGGGNAASRNVISGNTGAGIAWLGGGAIQGNYIGTNSAGTAALPNLGGGIVTPAGAGTIQGNVISGNAVAGVKMEAAQNLGLIGNFIGTAADGVTSLPNSDPGDGTGHGVWITNTSINNGVLGFPGNVIAFNQGDGVRIDGPAIRNPVRYNSIHGNGGLGINNASGGNLELQPLSLFVGSATQVSGNACFNCVSVDVYSDLADEGRIFEGSAPVQGGSLTWTFDGALSGPSVTATATDIDGNTSEFTAPVAVPEPESLAMFVTALTVLLGLERRRRIRESQPIGACRSGSATS